MMTFWDIDWADSNIESIEVVYDKAVLLVWNDALEKYVSVHCTGLVGLTNLCIWDDTIIMNAELCQAKDNNDYLKSVYSAYDKQFDYGGRFLEDVWELSVELVNHITFCIYCLKVEIKGDKGTVLLSHNP